MALLKAFLEDSRPVRSYGRLFLMLIKGASFCQADIHRALEHAAISKEEEILVGVVCHQSKPQREGGSLFCGP